MTLRPSKAIQISIVVFLNSCTCTKGQSESLHLLIFAHFVAVVEVKLDKAALTALSPPSNRCIVPFRTANN